MENEKEWERNREKMGEKGEQRMSKIKCKVLYNNREVSTLLTKSAK